MATARWGSGQRCARCLSYDMGSTLLAAQVEQSAGSDALIDRVQSEIRSPGYMDGRDEEGSQCDFRSLRGKLWREIMSAPWPSWSKTVTPLLAFYDFPAEHWKYIRTTNPIESVFATFRNRTRKTKGA